MFYKDKFNVMTNDHFGFDMVSIDYIDDLQVAVVADKLYDKWCEACNVMGLSLTSVEEANVVFVPGMSEVEQVLKVEKSILDLLAGHKIELCLYEAILTILSNGAVESVNYMKGTIWLRNGYMYYNVEEFLDDVIKGKF